MKFSISNIAWDEADDTAVYGLMKAHGFSGLEIAPTRVIPKDPYDNVSTAIEWKKELTDNYGFEIPSMQSIWFGRQENIFGSAEERNALLEYTKKAVDFASALKIHNLVFGCPKNRNMPDNASYNTAIKFFSEIAEYALSKQTVIGIEANPTIYNTNFINTTEEALKLINDVNSDGLGLNLDLGTMIYNNESIRLLVGNVNKISHVHISEPYLKPIEKRPIHKELLDLLMCEFYNRYISIEVSKCNIHVIKNIISYIYQ